MYRRWIEGGRGRRFAAGAATAGVTVAVVLAVSMGGAAASASPTATAARAKCGAIPLRALPKSPGNLLAKLPASVRSLYVGFGTPVLKSAWSNWKPPTSGKLTIGVSFNALINSFNATIYSQVLAQLKALPNVGQVISYTAASPQDIAGQLQQFQSLIQQHVSLIVTLAASGPAFTPAIQQAAAAGIPTVSLVNDIQSPDSVNIAANTWQDIVPPATSIIKAIGGKGNVLLVHGIPGTQTDLDSFTDFGQLLSACPNLVNEGDVNGEYNPPVTKSAVLQFLATHPQPIAAVFETATMAPYIMQAFQQAGRPIPPVLDVGAQEGSLAYWAENASTYHGGGSVGGPTSLATEAVRVVSRMLAGQGVKVNNVVWYEPIVTQKNLSTFASSSWTPTSQGTVENPPSTYVTNAQLNALFNHPKIKVP